MHTIASIGSCHSRTGAHLPPAAPGPTISDDVPTLTLKRVAGPWPGRTSPARLITPSFGSDCSIVTDWPTRLVRRLSRRVERRGNPSLSGRQAHCPHRPGDRTLAPLT